MKTLLSIVFLCIMNFSTAQSHSVVGAWYWSNSSNEISIVLKKSGVVEMHSGKKGDVILVKNLKVGQYTFDNNTLLISWKDNTSESYKLNFTDKGSLVFKNLDKKDATIKNKLTFNKVVDEEVITNPS